jgi:hypothetical protein
MAVGVRYPTVTRLAASRDQVLELRFYAGSISRSPASSRATTGPESDRSTPLWGSSALPRVVTIVRNGGVGPGNEGGAQAGIEPAMAPG